MISIDVVALRSSMQKIVQIRKIMMKETRQQLNGLLKRTKTAKQKLD